MDGCCWVTCLSGTICWHILLLWLLGLDYWLRASTSCRYGSWMAAISPTLSWDDCDRKDFPWFCSFTDPFKLLGLADSILSAFCSSPALHRDAPAFLSSAHAVRRGSLNTGRLLVGLAAAFILVFPSSRSQSLSHRSIAQKQPALLLIFLENSDCGIWDSGAEGGTRTPTSLSPLDPEPSASANSATSAFWFAILCVSRGLVKEANGSNLTPE